MEVRIERPGGQRFSFWTAGRPLVGPMPRNIVPRSWDWLPLGGVLGALVFCFRGQGQPLIWLMAGLLLPGLKFALVRAYRQRVLGWLGKQWGCLELFAAWGGPLPWLPTLMLVSLPAGWLFLSNHRTRGSGDTWPVIPTACGLVTKGCWDIQDYVRLAPAGYTPPGSAGNSPYCTVHVGRGTFSHYPAGMVPFAVPVLALSRLVGADLDSAAVLDRLEKWTAAWMVSAALGFFFLIALHLAPARQAWLATLLVATGSVMFSTVAQALWQHGGTIFWSLLIVLVEFRPRLRCTRAGSWIQGLAGAMMLACRLSAVVFLVPFGIWILLRAPRRAARWAGCCLLAYAPWAWIHWSIYGNVLGPSAHQLSGGHWSLNIGASLAGILVSPGRGLLVFQPWLGLAALWAVPWLRQRFTSNGKSRGPVGWEGFLGCVILLHLVMVAGWACWWGGSCYGSRLAADIIPLAGLLCVQPLALLWQRVWGRRLVVALGFLSFLIHAAEVYKNAGDWNNLLPIDSHPERLWSWSHAPFFYPLTHQP